MADGCDSPNIKQEPQSTSLIESRKSTPTQETISPYVLNRDKAVKKIIDAANRAEHADFQFQSNRLMIHLSAAAYGTMCKVIQRYYENSPFEVFLKNKMDQEKIITECLLSVKNRDNLKESLRISMYHTTSRILVNGSMYQKFVAEHLDQIRQSLTNSDEMIALNNDIKSKCQEFLNNQKTQRKSNGKTTPLKAPEGSGECRVETPDAMSFRKTPYDIPFGKTPDDMPVGKTPNDIPFGKTPDDMPVGKTPNDIPFGKTPDDMPIGKTPDAIPFAKTPDDMPIGKTPDDMPIGKTPDDIPFGKTPDGMPIGKKPDDMPIGKTPDDMPIGKIPDDIPFGKTPDAMPFGKTPDAMPFGKTPDDMPIGKTPDDNHIGKTPDAIPFAKTPDDMPIGKTPDDIPFGKTPDDIPIGKTPDDMPIGKTPDDIPFGKTPDDIPFGKTSDDIPIGKTPDDMPVGKTPDDIPFGKTSDDMPIGKTPDDIPFGKTPDDIPFGKTPDDIPIGKTSDDMPIGKTPDDIPFTETPNKKSMTPETFKSFCEAEVIPKSTTCCNPMIGTERNANTARRILGEATCENLNTPSKQRNDSDIETTCNSHISSLNTTPSTKVSPKCGRGSMHQEHTLIIQSNYTFLTQELSPLALADYLYQEFIFDDETHERITTNKDGRIAGMRIFLKALLNSGKSAFPKFLEGLRYTGYDHVADVLK